jgi:2-keto-4-pentenoate hydratase/2-oxohepta-3-ene-1,7-dioic acid hydratase in catechol pathway
VEPEGIRLHRGTPLVAWEPTETVVSWDQARLLAPVIPTKIVAVGRNYADHAAELGNELPESPMIFLKPPTSVIGPHQPIRLPPDSHEVHHEAEMAVVIGRVARNVEIEDAGAYILGYTAANDVTARDLQRRDATFARGKSFDTFCPLGPAIDVEPDLEALEVVTRVDGVERQRGRVGEMAWGPIDLLVYVSRMMTLEAGDLVLTGTPAGVGPLLPGARVTVEVTGVGELENRVEESAR